jgi:hypothetical protein
MAAKSGTPAMEPLRPTIPASVPLPAEAGGGFQGDVTVQQVGANSALDTQPDARQGRTAEGTQPAAAAPAQGSAEGTAPAASGTPAAADEIPRNTPGKNDKNAKKQKENKKKK